MEKISARPESREVESPQFDTIIVFGQGPVREIKLQKDLTAGEIEIWKKFEADPRNVDEPNFYVVEKDIDSLRKQQMQETGRFALKRWGKLNALAAGYMLLQGQTQELILSGGISMSGDLQDKYRQMLSQSDPKFKLLEGEEQERKLDLYIRYMVRWPSEAQLMKDIIVRTFSRQFEENYPGEKIEDRIKIEDRSRNSIENLFLSLAKYPELEDKRIALLSGDHHLKRILIIANDIVGLNAKDISAQTTLRERALRKLKRKYASLAVKEFAFEYPKLVDDEKRLISGLVEPQFLEYWWPFVGEIEDPLLFQHILRKFIEDPAWKDSVKEALSKVGINFDELEGEDIPKLSEEKPEEFIKLRKKIFGLKRLMLPGAAIKN